MIGTEEVLENPMEPTEAERRAKAEAASRIYRETHHVSQVKDIPDHGHFAVLVNDTYSYDDGYGNDGGYGRNATGHTIGYIVFDTDAALQAWIIENHSKKTYKVVKVQAVGIELKTVITIRD